MGNLNINPIFVIEDNFSIITLLYDLFLYYIVIIKMILFRSRVINQEHEPLYNKGLSQTSETDYDLNQVRTIYYYTVSLSSLYYIVHQNHLFREN